MLSPSRSPSLSPSGRANSVWELVKGRRGLGMISALHLRPDCDGTVIFMKATAGSCWDSLTTQR